MLDKPIILEPGDVIEIHKHLLSKYPYDGQGTMDFDFRECGVNEGTKFAMVYDIELTKPEDVITSDIKCGFKPITIHYLTVSNPNHKMKRRQLK